MYKLGHINCGVCGSDDPKLLGIRGNREYAGADPKDGSEHIVTNVVRCRKCSFVYTNPLIVTDMNGYNDPDQYISSSGIGPERLFGRTLSLIERYSQKGRLLDIGCGKGEFLSAAKKSGWEIHGVEPSAELAQFAAAACGIDVRPVSLKEARYLDSFFDAVTLNMVLEHVEKPRELLGEIRRILKSSGTLFIEVPNTDSLTLAMAARYFRLRGRNWSPLLSPLHYPFHSYGYNASSLRFLLEENNFDIKKIWVYSASLRGFRKDAGGRWFEKLGRDAVSRLAAVLRKGDNLMVIAGKR